MVRVGLVTTWGIRCGVQEYSRMLIENMRDPDVQITPIGGPYHVADLLPRVLAGRYDIIHFNYDSGFLGIFSPGVANSFRAFGAKLVITLNDHHARNNRAIFPFTNDFDRVVIHQKTDDGFVTIPIGIEECDRTIWKEENTSIGFAGFPLPQKGVLDVAHAAAILASETPRINGCTMVCPESQHIDTHRIGNQVRSIFPPVEYITAWYSQRDVMNILGRNLINVFPMRDGKSGISSSIRMGIGTGGYTVLSRSLMHADLWEDERYHDEIEWIDGTPADINPRKVADACLRALETKRRPKNILEDMTWQNTASQYAKLYHEITMTT